MTEAAEVRVLVADAAELFRLGVRAALEPAPELAVVAETADGHEAVSLARIAGAHIAVVGTPAAGWDGVEVTRRLTAATQPVTVLAVGDGDDDHVGGMLGAGARGYHRREVAAEVLRDSVLALVAGGSRICSEVVTALFGRFAAAVDARAAAATTTTAALSRREQQVLAEVARGHTNRQVAASLGLAEATVRGHLHRAGVKLGARSRTDAVRLAVLAGLVVLTED